MSNEQNKAIPQKLFIAMETNDQAALRELLAPNFMAYHYGSPDPINREELLQALSMYSVAFTDQEYTVKDQLAEGDRVTTRTTWEGTHSGEFMGLSPTGKRISASGIAISRIENGRIVERWIEIDQLGMLQQLGLVPSPQDAG